MKWFVVYSICLILLNSVRNEKGKHFSNASYDDLETASEI